MSVYFSCIVPMSHLGTRLGNIHFIIYTFYDLYISIGYILPTMAGYMSVAEFTCALWAQGWGIYINFYWIYSANNWGI